MRLYGPTENILSISKTAKLQVDLVTILEMFLIVTVPIIECSILPEEFDTSGIWEIVECLPPITI